MVEAIREARKSVFVEAYSFTSRKIAAALIDAKRRGVDVEVIFDRSESDARGSDAISMAGSGIPSFTNEGRQISPSSRTLRHAGYSSYVRSGRILQHGIAHSKVMIIDGNKVITGSFNFTKSAEDYNLENLLVISDDPPLVDAYTVMWKRYLAESIPYHPSGRASPHRRSGFFRASPGSTIRISGKE